MPLETDPEREIEALAAVLSSIPYVAIYLIGSAARGELAQGIIDGRRELFSDYEFFVVTPRFIAHRERDRVRALLDETARSFGYRNPLFHADFTTREANRLPSMRHTVFTFELRENGRLIAGRDMRHRLPAVTLETLDRRDTREILLKRLRAVAHGLPSPFILGRGARLDAMTEAVAGYLVARNALDLTTVFVPEAGALLPTYYRRVEWWRSHASAEPLNRFGPGAIEFLETCLIERRDLRFSEPARERYPRWVELMEIALGAVGLDGDAHGSPFAERPLSRGQWWAWARNALRVARDAGPTTALRWIRMPRKTMEAKGLLLAHRALAAWIRGAEREALGFLEGSWRLLSELSCGQTAAEMGGSFAERWLALRFGWRSYWERWVRLI